MSVTYHISRCSLSCNWLSINQSSGFFYLCFSFVSCRLISASSWSRIRESLQSLPCKKYLYSEKIDLISSASGSWKRSVFIPIPKKGNTKECSSCRTIALISHASKVMLKILWVRLQQYVNHELPDVQAGFRKGRGIRDQIANICWIIEKAREFQKNTYFCFIDYAKAFDCVDPNKLENSSRGGNTRPPDLPPEKSVSRSRSNS